MVPRPKRKLMSARDPQELLKEFFNQSDEHDSEYLRNQVVGDDGENNAFGGDSYSDSDEEIQRDEMCDVELGNVEEEELLISRA